MSGSNKLTIRVTTARRTQNIFWNTSGVEGAVNVGQTAGQLLSVPLSDMSDSDAYWNGVLNLVLPHIVA